MKKEILMGEVELLDEELEKVMRKEETSVLIALVAEYVSVTLIIENRGGKEGMKGDIEAARAMADLSKPFGGELLGIKDEDTPTYEEWLKKVQILRCISAFAAKELNERIPARSE